MTDTVVFTGALRLAWAETASRTASGVEEPTFRLGLTDGDLEIRPYAPVIVAGIVEEGDWRAAGSAGFRRLANWFFGRNEILLEPAPRLPG